MKDYLYLFCIGVLSVLLVFQTCSKKESVSLNESNLLAYNDSIRHYKTALGQVVESKRSITLERDNFKFLSDSLNYIIKNFKKPENIIEYRWRLKTDTVEVPLIINLDNTFSFKQDDGFNIRSGTVFKNKVRLDPLIVNNTQSIISGPKKDGWFKKKYYAVDIHNTNPYIQGQSVQHYVVVHRKSWHEKWYITIPSALGLGFILSK